MNTLHHDNWIIDIYNRIDAADYIGELERRQLRDEVHWCYRLGFISHDDYYGTLEYLDTQVSIKEAASERRHDVRMAQLAYDQALIEARLEYQQDVRDLFLAHVRFDRRSGLYYYSGIVDGLVKENGKEKGEIGEGRERKQEFLKIKE